MTTDGSLSGRSAPSQGRLSALDDLPARPFAAPLPLLLNAWHIFLRRWVLIAAIVGACLGAGIIITVVFQEIFLVRLP